MKIAAVTLECRLLSFLWLHFAVLSPKCFLTCCFSESPEVCFVVLTFNGEKLGICVIFPGLDLHSDRFIPEGARGSAHSGGITSISSLKWRLQILADLVLVLFNVGSSLVTPGELQQY